MNNVVFFIFILLYKCSRQLVNTEDFLKKVSQKINNSVRVYKRKSKKELDQPPPPRA